jgi:hypothetical protein
MPTYTRHTLLLRLFHSDDLSGPPIAEARRRIRYTGARKILPPSLAKKKSEKKSEAEGEAGGSRRAGDTGRGVGEGASGGGGGEGGRVERRFPQVS